MRLEVIGVQKASRDRKMLIPLWKNFWLRIYLPQGVQTGTCPENFYQDFEIVLYWKKLQRNTEIQFSIFYV